MEIEGGRVPREVDGNAVLGIDGEGAGAEAAHAQNVHLPRRKRYIVAPSLFDNRRPNVIF